METPTTLRGEIRQILAQSKDPMTHIEIMAKSKFAGDDKALAQALYQMKCAGEIRKAGKLQSAKGRALALYAIAGIAKAKKPRASAIQPFVKTKRGPYKKRAKPAGRSLALRKVQRRNALSPAADAPGFRCGIYSDGALAVERAGETFEMDQAEARVLLAYLSKVLPEARS